MCRASTTSFDRQHTLSSYILHLVRLHIDSLGIFDDTIGLHNTRRLLISVFSSRVLVNTSAIFFFSSMVKKRYRGLFTIYTVAHSRATSLCWADDRLDGSAMGPLAARGALMEAVVWEKPPLTAANSDATHRLPLHNLAWCSSYCLRQHILIDHNLGIQGHRWRARRLDDRDKLRSPCFLILSAKKIKTKMSLQLSLFTCFLLITSVLAAGKRGLGAPWDSVGTDLDHPKITAPGSRVSWIYNWEPYRPPGGRGLEFVAMLRTGHQDDLDRFYQNMPHNGAGTLLCLNEPDHTEQANLSPEQAADVWRRHCWPQKQRGIRLGAPAITNGPQGIPWLQRFLDITRDVPPDFVTTHWYGVDGNDLIRHVQRVRDISQKPVWLTEFAHVRDNIYDQRGLMQQVTAWMDSQWWVERYAWYSCSRYHNINEASRLLDQNGNPTDLIFKYIFNPVS